MFRKRKVELYEIPLEVRALGERVMDWHRAADVIVIKPKEAFFDELLVQYRPIGLFGFEHVTMFTCSLNLVSEGAMDEGLQSLYRELKSFECVLRWKGFLRKPLFKSSPQLTELKKYIPQLNPSSKLADLLNLDRELIRLVRFVKPDEITVALHSLPSYVEVAAGDPLMLMAEFYRNPTKIAWLIILSKMLTRGPSYAKLVNGIYDIMNLISMNLKSLKK